MEDKDDIFLEKARAENAPCFFLYPENHSLGEWFKRAYGDEDDRKTPFDIIEVRSANCTKNIKRRTFK